MSLEAVTIPSGVTSIGSGAFKACIFLASVTIPSSVTSIGSIAFLECPSLGAGEVNLPCSWNEKPLYTFDGGVTVNIPAHQNLTHSVNDEGNVISEKCGVCGNELGTLTINAENSIYDGTTHGATVEKTGIFENEEVTVDYYQGDTLIDTDAPVEAGTYTAKITYGGVTASCQFEIAKATPPALTIPTAATITYGEKLSASTLSDSSWAWVDGTIVPNANAYYNAYIEVDDSNYDYTGVYGYDNVNHRVVRDITVIINRATLTITANSYTIKVGDTLPTYAYDVTGLVNNDTFPFDASLSCSATDSNTVGTYPITISGVASDALASLYAPIYVNGELTITEKDIQEIAADDVTLTYGETKNIGATTNGNGAISYSTTSDVISVAADGTITAHKVGIATVTITAAETADYAEATKTISVTVNKATPTAEMFTYTEPANLTYDGTAKSADVVVKDGITGMGEITVKYYQNGTEVTPINAGEYTVKIDVAESHNYSEVHNITTENWTFKIHDDANSDGFCDMCSDFIPPNLENDYYQIANAGNLMWFAQQVNEGQTAINAKLTADIDLENKPWTPIGETGEDNNNFRGVFDGQGHTIKGLYVEGSKNGLGFFGEVRTGTVKNFIIYGNVVVNTKVDYVGGVIGSICGVNGETGLERNGAVIQNITSFVNVTAKAHGIGIIGGFVGYANHQSLIEKCAWCGTFDAGEYRVSSGAGGFIGKIQENTSEVTIRNCGAYGTIKTNYAGNYNNLETIYMGGFLSFSNTGAKTTIENCLFAGRFERGENLTDQAVLGAFGTLRSVNAIKNCYYLGDDGLEAVHSDSPLKPGSDNVEITSVTEDDLRNNTIATQLGLCWEQGEHYPIILREGSPWYGSVTYTDNGDGTHKKFCSKCGYVENASEPHIDENGDEYCDNCGAIYNGIGAHLAGYSVSLNGSIGVNFHMDLTQDVLDDNEAYMLFTLPNGTTQKVMVSDARAKGSADIEGKTYYIFTCNVAAKEMTDTIQAQLITSDGSKTQVYEYSVREYANRILSGNYDAKTKELVRAMLHYGAYSQEYFNYNTTNLANAGVDIWDLSGPNDWDLFKPSISNDDKVGSFTSAYLTLESDTAINLKFKLADGVSFEDLTFVVQDTIGSVVPATIVTTGNVCLISLTGIKASDLDTMYDFSVTDKEGNKSTITYSAMSYARAVAKSEMDQKLKDVTAALRIFNIRANDKFEN